MGLKSMWSRFLIYMGVSKNRGTPKPQIIHFNRVFRYKPSILGTPILGNTHIIIYYLYLHLYHIYIHISISISYIYMSISISFYIYIHVTWCFLYYNVSSKCNVHWLKHDQMPISMRLINSHKAKYVWMSRR